MTAVGRGRAAEALAAHYLQIQGFSILDRNRRGGGGEIDLIAREGDTLVFVEVRLRRADDWAGAARSLDHGKMRRLRAAARLLAREPALRWPGRSLRLDVVLLELRAGGLRLWHHRRVRAAEGLPRRRCGP